MKNRFITTLLVGLCTAFSFHSPGKDRIPHDPAARPCDTVKIMNLILSARDQEYKNYNKAKELAREALALQENCTSLPTRAEVLITWGWINWMDGNYDEALDANNEAIKIWERLGRRDQVARNIHSKALTYYSRCDYDKAAEEYGKCLDIFREEKDSVMMAQTLLLITLVYYEQADYKEAANYLIQSFRIRQNLVNYRVLIFDFSKMGPGFLNERIYRQELEYLLAANPEIKARHDNLKLSTNYQNIGMVYFYLKDYSRAIHWLKQGLYLRKSLNYVPLWFSLGDAYMQNGQYDSARYYYRLSIKESNKFGPKDNLMQSYEGLANVAVQEKHNNEALKFFNTAMRINRELENHQEVARLYLKIAGIYTQQHDFHTGLMYAEKSLGMAEEIKAGDVLTDVYDLLADLNFRTGNFEVAYEYQKKLIQLDRKIHDERSMYNMALVTIQYDTEKKQEEIKQLGEEIAINNAKLKFQYLFSLSAAGLGILLVVLAVLLYVRYRHKIRNEKLLAGQKKKLEQSNAEKEILLSEIHHRVKNNLQVISSLLNIQLSGISDPDTQRLALESQNRIKAMGLIHENLYRHQEFGGVYVKKYLSELTDNLIDSFDCHPFTRIEVEDIKIDIDSAIPLGLIFNELITNALKHGCSAVENPELFIELKFFNADELSLVVKDNGPGSSGTVNTDGFGRKLVTELTKRLYGSIEFISNPGTCVCIKFKKFKLAS